jgi:flagellar motor switch protein FliN/FliY
MSQQVVHGNQDSMLAEFAEELASTADDVAAWLGARADSHEASGAAPGAQGANFDVILGIPVSVKIVLGSATMPVSSLLKLGRGAVIPLDRKVGEPVDVVVNGRVVARGEVVVLEDSNSRFGISLTEIIGSAGSPKA